MQSVSSETSITLSLKNHSEHLQCWYSVAVDWISRRVILQTAEEVLKSRQRPSSPFNHARIVVLTAYPPSPQPRHLSITQITGPWDATPVYDIPAPFNGTSLMAYTGKAHPEVFSDRLSFVLSPNDCKFLTAQQHMCTHTTYTVQLADPDEIVFTYVANTPGVVYPLFEDGADIMYVPRFVRLKLKGGGGGEGGRRGLKKRRWRVRQKLLEQEREQEQEPGQHRALRTRRRRRKGGGH